MTKVMWVGDTHANIDNMQRVLLHAVENRIDQIIQLGDFGWWPRWKTGQRFIDFTTEEVLRHGINPLIFIPGNHEDYQSLQGYYNVMSLHKLTDGIYMAGRGYHCQVGQKRIAFVGGGVSVDKHIRTVGVDWFEEESISQRECYNICNNLSRQGIDILACHDTVDFVQNIGNLKLLPNFQAVRQALTAIADVCRPDRIIHGHYHLRYYLNDIRWGNLLRIDGLSHDNGRFENQVLIEEL